MTAARTAAVPPVPARCADRPTVGGLVHPYVNVTLAGGGVDFRAQHHTRAVECVSNNLCQVCAQPLVHPIVLLGTDRALAELVFGEPPLHPECAVYTSRACPMVAGRRTHYASGPSVSERERGRACFLPGCDCGGWVAHPGSRQAGAPAQPWFAVYVTDYAIATRPDGYVLGPAVTPDQVLAVRLVSRPGEGRLWRTVGDALAGYRPPASRP